MFYNAYGYKALLMENALNETKKDLTAMIL